MASKVADYDTDQDRCRDFLTKNLDKYSDLLQSIANRADTVFAINLDHVREHADDLADDILGNTNRFVYLFAKTVDAMLPEPSPEIAELPETILDMFIRHRGLLLERALPDDGEARQPYPDQLLRRYEVVFHAPSEMKPLSIRQVDAAHIGKTIKIQGVVTRCTAVKPQITVATYACEDCGVEVYQEVNKPEFMPLDTCKSASCARNKRKGRLHLQTRGSLFQKFQEYRIQELSQDVPTGHVPRSLTIMAKGETTRKALPGDTVTVTGIYLPTSRSGFRQMRVGLLSDTHLQAFVVDKAKKYHKDLEITDGEVEIMREWAEEEMDLENDIYQKMADSIAPEIYGHENVKKALFLLLLGGTYRSMSDGMRIRGDINVCLMGDPGVAKSQMLKATANMSPRGIYTTGRGSSGVGLTAAVTKDPVTNELVLEGGALVLADMGVCCIDEFDKMEEGDRTGIHEVMEQQTISIAKAGITTTLNARASILAAANPLYGRYNPSKTATQNINLPAALLSRFDLVFLLLDKPDEEADQRLAQHITYVHKEGRYPNAQSNDPDQDGDGEQDSWHYEKDFVRKFIAVAKQLQPTIPKELAQHIVALYLTMREDAETDTQVMTFTSPRTLLAILRLSTALARVRLSETVTEADVDEAVKLMRSSKETLLESQTEVRRRERPEDAIFQIIKNALIASGDRRKVRVADVKAAVSLASFNDEQFKQTVEAYSRLDVIQLSDNGEEILAVNNLA